MEFIIRRQSNYSILNCYVYIHTLKVQIHDITSADFFVRFFSGGRETKSDESEDQSSNFCIDKYMYTYFSCKKHDTCLDVNPASVGFLLHNLYYLIPQVYYYSCYLFLQM